MQNSNKQYASKQHSPAKYESPQKGSSFANQGNYAISAMNGPQSLNSSPDRNVNQGAVKHERIAQPQGTFNSQANHKRVKSLPYNLPKMRPDVVKQVDLQKRPVYVDMNKTEQSKHWNQ